MGGSVGQRTTHGTGVVDVVVVAVGAGVVLTGVVGVVPVSGVVVVVVVGVVEVVVVSVVVVAVELVSGVPSP